MSQQSPTATAAASAKKGKGKLLIIIGGLVALLAAAGGAGWFFFLRPKPAEAAAKTEAAPKGDPGIVAFDPFVVNLADPGGAHFLRLSLKLVVDGQEKAKEIAENEVAKSRVRSAVLEFLTLQTADHLVTPEGKTELKKQIAERAGAAMHETRVLDVLFSEFIVQF